MSGHAERLVLKRTQLHAELDKLLDDCDCVIRAKLEDMLVKARAADMRKAGAYNQLAFGQNKKIANVPVVLTLPTLHADPLQLSLVKHDIVVVGQGKATFQVHCTDWNPAFFVTSVLGGPKYIAIFTSDCGIIVDPLHGTIMERFTTRGASHTAWIDESTLCVYGSSYNNFYCVGKQPEQHPSTLHYFSKTKETQKIALETLRNNKGAARVLHSIFPTKYTHIIAIGDDQLTVSNPGLFTSSGLYLEWDASCFTVIRDVKTRIWRNHYKPSRPCAEPCSMDLHTSSISDIPFVDANDSILVSIRYADYDEEEMTYHVSIQELETQQCINTIPLDLTSYTAVIHGIVLSSTNLLSVVYTNDDTDSIAIKTLQL